jgi:hypothetical protein
MHLQRIFLLNMPHAMPVVASERSSFSKSSLTAEYTVNNYVQR